jgi:hypothetical protein
MFRKKIYTEIAVFKALSYIKKHRDNAYTIGKELCTLFFIVYSEFKRDDTYNTIYIWNSLSSINGFDSMILSSILHSAIDYPRFFSKLNLKILQLKPNVLGAFMRGYYINDMNMFSTNISTAADTKYVTLYDSHYHFLLFIYNYLSTNISNVAGVRLVLNDASDSHSFNEESDAMCYKLIFEKKEYDFIDPIRLVLSFFYKDVMDPYDTCNNEDRNVYIMFNKYLTA